MLCRVLSWDSLKSNLKFCVKMVTPWVPNFTAPFLKTGDCSNRVFRQVSHGVIQWRDSNQNFQFLRPTKFLIVQRTLKYPDIYHVLVLSSLISVSTVDILTEKHPCHSIWEDIWRGKRSGGTVTTTAWIFMSTSQSWPGDSPKTIIVFNIQYKTRPVIVLTVEDGKIWDHK